MEKKTIATTIFGILILIFIISFGATLAAFKVSKEKVEVKHIYISAGSGYEIKDEDGKIITELDVKSSAIGVRPATGEEDDETQIPSTINDEVGTEGAYATFNLSASGDWAIILDSCSLTAGESENLDNVKIGIMESHNEALSGKDIGGTLTSGSAVNKKEIVVVVWLDAKTTKAVASADISIGLKVIML